MASERNSPWTIETIAGRRVLRVEGGTDGAVTFVAAGFDGNLRSRTEPTKHLAHEGWVFTEEDAEWCGTTLAAIRAALTEEGKDGTL
jgi:hypothetical protein